MQHCSYDCGEPGQLVWRDGRGGYIHCCPDTIDALYAEIDELRKATEDLGIDDHLGRIEELEGQVDEFKELLARVPVYWHPSLDPFRNYADARRALKAHRGPVRLWITPTLWVRISKKAADQLVNDMVRSSKRTSFGTSVQGDALYLYLGAGSSLPRLPAEPVSVA